MILWYSLRNINIYICSWSLFLVHSSWNLWNFLNGQNHKDLFCYVNEITFRKHLSTRVSLMAQTVKKKKKNAYNAGDAGWIPGSERLPREENGYLLHYFCLENSMDRGAWWVTVHRVAKVGQDWAIKTFTFQGWQWKLPDQGIRGLEFIVPPGKLWEGERGWRLTK